MADEDADGDDDVPGDRGDDASQLGRRRFLKVATCAIGGGIGLVVAVPAVKYLLDPVGRRVVTTGGEPIDVIALDHLEVGGPPVRVRLIAREVRDAWSTVRDVPLGSVWLRRTGDRDVEALSAICPHLGCAVAFEPGQQRYQCPCHDSRFDTSGKRLGGPAERGLDPLPVEVDGDRVKVAWIRYRQGGSDREPV
ncbi:MAG: ubiquinol-cytochrome c reductase iron-sulfur subunit [Kofleriaceae bacterium]|nr:ubiquinol-cytochrome c reductase iron-sulfur subunit [Myxococcales bacterium]MCB9560539.1 ubiquinol-cytochrome c reductase iron-sulfur subunit [Kofleriaceae bacterium]MCB9573283.1 ubiquinol-cytochrome c reductase iron-sulfur subunit [Kofleriaceae bacterium]